MNANRNYPYPQRFALQRKHLLNKLEAATHCPLTLIIAPPGYGKTTLISQFVQMADIPVAWQTLDKQDQDLPTLFEHSLTALSQIVTNISTVDPVARTTPGELATIVTDYLRDTVITDFLYIIDDIHQLLESPNAKTWLRAFIAALPPTCHLILSGHAFPPISIAGLIAHGELVSVGQEQLSFGFEEVAVLAETIRSTLSADQINDVYDRMKGWPAGTALALQPLPIDIEATLFDGEKAPEALFDALADRLFRTQSVSLQSFLLSSSTLLYMTPTLCQSALGLTNSLEHLMEALQRNLFISEIPGGLTYHSLFRDFLQHKLQSQYPEQFIQHHINAGRWFETENRLEEAFDHYVIAEHWEAAANIAERSAHIYLGQGKTETLLRWEDAFKSTHTDAPRFFHFCAMIHRDRYNYELAEADAKAAEMGFRTQGNTVGLIQIALLRASMDNLRGNFQAALDRAEPFSQDTATPMNLKGYALAIIGTAALHLNQLDKALLFLEKALPLWEETGDQFAVAHLLMTFEVMYLRLGRFPDAAQCIQKVLSIRRSFGESVSIVTALNNLGYHYHLLGEYQQALKTIQEGLQLVSRIPENRVESFLLFTLGDIQRDRGAVNEAFQAYQRSLELTDNREPFLRANILVNFSTLRRWQGKVNEAHQLALEAFALTEKHDLNWERQMAKLALHAIRIHLGEFEIVRQDLNTIVENWSLYPSPYLAPALALYAHGALMANDEAAAYQVLKIALSHGNHWANLQPLIAEIVHTPLLKRFVERYTDRLPLLAEGIKRLETAQAEPSVEHPTKLSNNMGSTYSLKVSVLGRERVERDTNLVSISDWEAASARELFFFLLFKQSVSYEEIGLTFWPDNSSQQIRGKFHTTLHRVRDAVGSNVVIFEDNLYAINPQIDVWCDVFEFQAVVRQAQLYSPLLAHTEGLWRRAVELYRGDFLQAFDADWIVAYRQSLFEMHIDSLLGLAHCVSKRGNPHEALDILNRALKADPYREDVHRAILYCYHQLGERSLISQHFDKLTRLLNEELGITPSSETRMLTQKLLR